MSLKTTNFPTPTPASIARAWGVRGDACAGRSLGHAPWALFWQACLEYHRKGLETQIFNGLGDSLALCICSAHARFQATMHHLFLPTFLTYHLIYTAGAIQVISPALWHVVTPKAFIICPELHQSLLLQTGSFWNNVFFSRQCWWYSIARHFLSGHSHFDLIFSFTEQHTH